MEPNNTPGTAYFHTKEDFDHAVGHDFIEHANHGLAVEGVFLVGLSHGVSPSGVYQYIFEHYI